MVKENKSYKQQARVMKALANETRLLIVDRLYKGECTVGELTALTRLDQSTVSKHLSVLKAHGIVEDRREGSRVFYALRTPCVVKFFSCTSEVLRQRS
jgi:ArsR family transcriptional regulator